MLNLSFEVKLKEPVERGANVYLTPALKLKVEDIRKTRNLETLSQAARALIRESLEAEKVEA